MPGPVRGIGDAFGDLDRLFHETIEILDRVFQPFDFRKRDGHMNANLKEGVFQTDRDAKLGGEPADPHDVGDLAMDIEQVGAEVFISSRLPVASRYSPLLICVQLTA